MAHEASIRRIDGYVQLYAIARKSEVEHIIVGKETREYNGGYVTDGVYFVVSADGSSPISKHRFAESVDFDTDQDTSFVPFTVDAIDYDNYIVAGSKGIVAKMDSRGAWSLLHRPCEEDIVCIDFRSHLVGVACSGKNHVYVTFDGGMSWQGHLISELTSINEVKFVSDEILLIQLNSGTLVTYNVRTGDKELNTGVGGIASSQSRIAYHDRTCLLVGSMRKATNIGHQADVVLRRSTDWGSTWQTLLDGFYESTAFGLLVVYLNDRGIGLALGVGRAGFYSMDSGATWTNFILPDNIPTSFVPSDVTPLGDNSFRIIDNGQPMIVDIHLSVPMSTETNYINTSSYDSHDIRCKDHPMRNLVCDYTGRLTHESVLQQSCDNNQLWYPMELMRRACCGWPVICR